MATAIASTTTYGYTHGSDGATNTTSTDRVTIRQTAPKTDPLRHAPITAPVTAAPAKMATWMSGGW